MRAGRAGGDAHRHIPATPSSTPGITRFLEVLTRAPGLRRRSIGHQNCARTKIELTKAADTKNLELWTD